MSAREFVISPEVHVYNTHLYGMYMPRDAWIAPEPPIIRLYIAVTIMGVPEGVMLYDGTYDRREVADRNEALLLALMADDPNHAGLALALREMSGHRIPISLYDPETGLWLMKLTGTDEKSTPCGSIHPQAVRV